MQLSERVFIVHNQNKTVFLKVFTPWENQTSVCLTNQKEDHSSLCLRKLQKSVCLLPGAIPRV